jgi:DNA-binding NarL/FixJ family response regulator
MLIVRITSSGISNGLAGIEFVGRVDVMRNNTRVVIADDHAPVRKGITRMLERVPDIQVVGEASDGAEALDMVQSLIPDVLILDVEMPNLNGRRVAQQIQAEDLPVKVLVLSAYDDNQYILGMLENGVAGYLTKDEAPELLVKAVRGVARGEQGWVSKRVANRIGSWEHVSGNERVTLTNQELKILGFIAEKKTDRDIAQGLNLSVEDVANLVKILCDKFSAHSRVELAVRARKDGFI